MPPGPYRANACQERELTLDHIQTFLTTQGLGGPPRMSGQLNAGANSETTQTLKTIHIIHSQIHSKKANMKGWWRPNDIRGLSGPKSSWHLCYRWGKTPKKPHSGNLSRPGIEPGSAAWQAHVLPPAPQWWTVVKLQFKNWIHLIIKYAMSLMLFNPLLPELRKFFFFRCNLV